MPVSRRQLLFGSSAALLLAGAGSALDDLIGDSGANATSTPTLATYSVTDYGAFPDGTDATSGFQQAINAASATGGTVTVPSGVFTFSSAQPGYTPSLVVPRTAQTLTISGVSPDQTVLLQTVPGQTLLNLRAPNTTVEGLTLNCQTYVGGSCLKVDNGYTTLQNCRALGSKAKKQFTLYYTGPLVSLDGAPPVVMTQKIFEDQWDKSWWPTVPAQYMWSNNTIRNCEIVDEIEDDGFSFSFQQFATISGISHYGSRLAIYICQNLSIEDYVYRPNPVCNVSRSVTDGFYITPPSRGIRIKGFTTYGQGGIIGGNGQVWPTRDVEIDNLVFMTSENRLEVGDVAGLTVKDSQFWTAATAQSPVLLNSLYFDGPGWDPTSSTITAPNATKWASPGTALGVVVQGGQVPEIHFAGQMSDPSIGAIAASFTGVTFPSTAGEIDARKGSLATFVNRGPGAGPAPAVTIADCTFDNSSGGVVDSVVDFTTDQAFVPTPTALPTVTPTTASHGTLLTADPGTWQNADGQFTYQWWSIAPTVTGEPAPTAQMFSGPSSSPQVTVPTTIPSKYTVWVEVTATNATGSSGPVPSSTSVTIN